MSELRETRLEKGKALAALGQGPYGLRYEPSHRTAELQAAHADLANGEEREVAVAVAAVCHEPGFHTIFEEASPTFKQRFMYMSGYTDETAFNEFCKTLTWEGHAEKIRAPYLCVAGEADELSPLEHTDRLFKTLQSPKQLVVYQDSRHSVGNVPSAHLGPHPQTLVADWVLARLNGKPFASERWFVKASGEIARTPY